MCTALEFLGVVRLVQYMHPTSCGQNQLCRRLDGSVVGEAADVRWPCSTGVDLVAVLSSDMDGSQRTEYTPDGANVVLDPRAHTIRQ